MPKANAKVNDLSAFRSQYDRNVIIPNKIKAALARMLKESSEAWLENGDFSKLSGVGLTELGTFKTQFEKHIVEVGGSGRGKRIWFADPKVATKARS